ncbi:hypothetical protein WR25_12658 isoform E [Diploscapter pachys]|uniref:AAA+ ATPase domain-containing protein n=1 Tax=Diploscapter pachys TaxID=2018661 RepID=A0A2A2LXK4_9BILA|nr:hypothetical protein WR25_12658 isoform E [Diploscapter pachys]
MSEESLGRLRNAARLLEAEVGKRVELSKLRFLMKFVSDTSNALKDSEDEGALKEHRTGLQTVVQMLQTVCQIRQRKAGILLISMSFGEFLQEKEMQQTVGDGRIAPCSLADSNLSIPTYNENSSEDEEEEQSTGRSHIKSCKSVKDAANEFDNFAESRRIAIESTIVTKLDELPSFSDIVGLDEAKNTLLEALVDPLLYPEWFKNSDLRPWKAVLLFGPPGTGKSALSQAIVKQIHSVLYQVSSSDLISSWSGQSEKLIRELFDHAIAQGKTTVIFIDEVDSICRVRHSSEEDANRRVKVRSSRVSFPFSFLFRPNFWFKFSVSSALIKSCLFVRRIAPGNWILHFSGDSKRRSSSACQMRQLVQLCSRNDLLTHNSLQK